MPGRAARLEVWAIALLVPSLSGCTGPSPQGGDAVSPAPADLFSNFTSCLKQAFGYRIDCHKIVARMATPGLPGPDWICRATYPNGLRRIEVALYEHHSTGLLAIYLSDARGFTHMGRINISTNGQNISLDATFPGRGWLPTGIRLGTEFGVKVDTNNLTVTTNWPPFAKSPPKAVMIGGLPVAWYQVHAQHENGTRYYFSPMTMFNGQLGPADNFTFLGAQGSPYYVRVIAVPGPWFEISDHFEDEILPLPTEPCKPTY